MCIRDSYRLTREKAPKVAVFGPKKEVDRQLAMMYLQQGMPVSYTHLRAHETVLDLVCRLLLEKKKHNTIE